MPIADLHCDTIHRLHYGGSHGDLLRNDCHIDLERLIASNYTLQVFASFVQLDAVKDPLESCLLLLDDLDAQMALYGDYASKVLKRTDLEKTGLKILYSVEEGGVIGSSEENLDLLYSRGVRSVTLTWNFENSLGYPNADFIHQDKGLTAFGKKMVEKMAHMGIAPDVSHLSDQGFQDVADILKKPFLASHSNARSVHCHPRNLTDAQIRTVADLGGVIGLNFCAYFLDGTTHSTLEALLRHFDHIYKVGGAEVLALGSDFDGITDTVEIEGCQGMPLLEAALVKAGYGSALIEKALYKNALRFFNDVLK